MVKLRSCFALANDAPYLALTGELWGVFREFFKEKWLRYIESALYMNLGDELFTLSWKCCFVVYFHCIDAKREITTTITIEWARNLFITTVHTLTHFLHDIMSPLMSIEKIIFAHRLCVSLNLKIIVITSHFIVQCIKCAMHRVPQLLGSPVERNALDIDYIHGDIHGRSCQKPCLIIFKLVFSISLRALISCKFYSPYRCASSYFNL